MSFGQHRAFALASGPSAPGPEDVSVPGPVLVLTRGEPVEITVVNRLSEATSIHWHGVLVPFQMDGVPGVSFPGIKPHTTFVYEYDVVQSGTYWYHSHSDLQEQMGHYGPMVIDPAGRDPVASDREYLVVLSDWSFLHPHAVFRKLKQQPGYFNQQRQTLASLVAAEDQPLGERLHWAQMRMDPTDVSDVTSYTYYDNAATCPGASPTGCRGQVETLTNAVGHVTSITEYNAHGQPLSITDPNGLVTTLAYDARQRLTSRNVGGEITSYDYDGVGQLTKVTLPDGSFLSYIYDAAHRLKEINDSLGNRIVYTLDAIGNRTLEEVRDPLNALAQTRSRVYNSLNRLSQEIGAASQTTTYGYDDQGNLTSINGPLAGTTDTTSNQYDALNRLIRVTQPGGGQVNYGYDALDQLTSVSDPRGLVTTYNINGLGNLNQQVSPDTGTTTNTYDAAGNLLTQTDAKGQLTTYTYDALNRVSSITYQGGVVHTYQYDQGVNQKGRLTTVIEPNSTTQYAYNPKGRLTSETRTINGVAYVTGYSYDSAGRLSGMTYPSGRTVTYTLDGLGRILAHGLRSARRCRLLGDAHDLPPGGVHERRLWLDRRLGARSPSPQPLAGVVAATRVSRSNARARRLPSPRGSARTPDRRADEGRRDHRRSVTNAGPGERSGSIDAGLRSQDPAPDLALRRDRLPHTKSDGGEHSARGRDHGLATPADRQGSDRPVE